jgi:hypothetical protein
VTWAQLFSKDMFLSGDLHGSAWLYLGIERLRDLGTTFFWGLLDLGIAGG